MTDPTPLRTALDDLAASAPAAVLDVDGVRRRIRRRRRVRHGAYGGAAVLTTAAAGVSIAVVLTPGDGADTPAIATPAPVQQTFDYGVCGQPVTTRGQAPSAPLELTVDIADTVSYENDGLLGTVTITNTSDERVAGSSGPGAEAWIGRDGITVTESGGLPAVVVPIALEPGERLTYDLFLSLRHCTTAPNLDDEPLEPGRYDIYVEWSMSSDGGANDITLYSGPIAIDIR